MDLLGKFKRKHNITTVEEGASQYGRQQLNMTVDWRLKEHIKGLAAEFGVPRYVITEHALEIALYHLSRGMRDEKMAAMLRRHLIGKHLLDDGSAEDEAILRLGEGGNISPLLVQVRPILRDWRKFRRALNTVEQTHNMAYVERCREELMRSVVGLALWLEGHHPDELKETIADGGEVQVDPTSGA